MFLYSFSSKLLIWVLVSFPSLLVSCRFFFISHNANFIAAWVFLMLLMYPVSSWSILITSVLNSASDRLAISLSFSCIFAGTFKYSFLWDFFILFYFIFFVSACLLCSNGQNLKCSPGWGNPCHCIVVLYVGEGLRGKSAACSALGPLSVTSSVTHKQMRPFWCWVPVGSFVYVLGHCGSFQWTLLWGWEFLPPPQPHRFFQLQVLRFYLSELELWVTRSVLFPSCSSWFIHMQMWDCPVCQPLHCLVHQLPFCLPKSSHWPFAVSPLQPGCSSPPLLPFWMNVSSLPPWLSDFHTVRFSGSSGCFAVF